MTARWVVTLVLDSTSGNPRKWDWDALLDETVVSISTEQITKEVNA